MTRILLAAAALAAIPAAADFRYSESHLQFYVPGAPWALTIPREDWKVVQEGRRPDGGSYYYFVASDRPMQLSVYLERTTECTSAASCLKRWRSQTHPSMQGSTVRQEGERNGFSVLVYDNPDVKAKDRSVATTNVSAHAYRDGQWIDFRVSAVSIAGSKPPDAGPLLALIDKLAIGMPVLSGPRRYPAGTGFIEMDVPADWRDEMVAGRVPTIKLMPPKGKGFQVLVSAFPLPPGHTVDTTLANARHAAEEALKRATETSIEPVAIRGMSAQGHYFKATDKAPAKDGFRHMAQGEVVTGKVAALFTILSNDGEERSVERALGIIAGMRNR
jgi:hypothetical protein